MREVTAYKVEQTGGLHENPADACRDEFKYLMRQVAGHLPSDWPRHQSGGDTMEWLAGRIASGSYPSALPALLEAIAFFQHNQTTIENKK